MISSSSNDVLGAVDNVNSEQAAFDRLHPALQHHIINSLGWSSLRPTQLAAIAPVLDGSHCILLAPTAGGKTEAAIFPVLSKMLTEGWRDLAVLYVCPIRALLNNLEPRLSHYFGLVGRRVGVWHGDVSETTKKRHLKDPPDLLLTTPESIEGMLISSNDAKRDFLRNVKLIVVDELHAFGGDDRGWHVRCLIERLRRWTEHRVQVVGLTATVGNPKALIDWLVSGEESVVVGEGHAGTEADITLDFVGSIENAATVISRLHHGEKRLVFCDSRSKTEELTALLRGHGVRAFVSHSSLSADERRQAETAFAEESSCVIVATSTLELGIDVGDLDRVIQIDAPGSVASFLQRMGRTGRRAGTKRNCLFLATEVEGLLIGAAIVRMWREGYVEPVKAPQAPWHLVAQQAMAMVLQYRGMPMADLLVRLVRMFQELDPRLIESVIDTMLEQGILWNDNGLLGLGERGEKEFGRRHFEAIVSTFNSPMLLSVVHGQREMGFVDPITIQARNTDEGTSSPKLILAGRYWRVVSFDWKGRVVWVEPSEDKGKASWFGTSRALGFALCQTIKNILADGRVPAQLSKRAQIRLNEISETFSFLSAEGVSVAQEKRPDGHLEWRWWSFAGGAANFVLADIAARNGVDVKSYDNFSLRVQSVPQPASWDLSCKEPTETSRKKLIALAKELKFGNCLSGELQVVVLSSRLRNVADAEFICRVDHRTVNISG